MDRIPENTKLKIYKLRALYLKGDAGESENAQMAMLKILKEYGLDESVFDEMDEPVIEYEITKPKEEIFIRLFEQIIVTVGVECLYYSGARKGSKRADIRFIKGTVTKVELFKLYWEQCEKAFRKEVNELFIAFVNVNRLFPVTATKKSSDDNKPLTEEQKNAIEKMASVKKVDLQKRLK